MSSTIPAQAAAASSNPGRVPFVLTPADIHEFRQLIEKHCGVSLTEIEAWNRATELVALYRMFLGPIPEDPAIAGLLSELSGAQEPDARRRSRSGRRLLDEARVYRSSRLLSCQAAGRRIPDKGDEPSDGLTP